MDHEAVEIPLTLMSVAPVHVDGERALVLNQPQVGRIEVGSPFAHDDIWQDFPGDLVSIVVVEKAGGMTSGGGGTWDSERLGCLMSEPGSGDDPTELGVWPPPEPA